MNCPRFELGVAWGDFNNPSTQHQANTTFAPVLGLCFSLRLAVSLGVPLCHGEKQQLVTPYGGERRGCFEHLQA